MEISFRVVDSAKDLLGNTRDPVAAWEALEKRFGARQEGMSLIAKLQLADWDRQGAISTHRDYMVDLRTQLEDTGMTLADQAFYSCFAESLPESLDLFITLYEDSTYNVDCLCNKFAKYGMRKNVRASKTAKPQSVSDGSVALFSQQQEKRRETDLSDVTCYGCGKKGHLKCRCPEPSEQEPEGAESVEDTPSTSKADTSQGEGASTKKPLSGTLYTAMAHTGMCADDELTAKYYVDSGASEHLIPSKVYLRSYREFDRPVETYDRSLFTALDIYGLQHPSTVRNARSIWKTCTTHLEFTYGCCRWEARGPGVGLPSSHGTSDHNGYLFADIVKAKKVHPVELQSVASGTGLAGWTTDSGEGESTYQELLERLGKVAVRDCNGVRG